MTNPAPRPALRKAPDADLHPAHAESSTPVANDIRDLEVELAPAPTGIFGQYRGDLDRLTVPARALGEADPASILIIEEDLGKSSKKHKQKDGKKKKGKDHKDKQAKKGKKHDNAKTRLKDKAKGSHSRHSASQRIDLRVAVPAPVRRTLRAGTQGSAISENEAADSARNGRKSR